MTAVASNVRKPCPFCGSKPLMKRSHSNTTTLYQLECRGKDCHVQPFAKLAPDQVTALRYWNRRAEIEV